VRMYCGCNEYNENTQKYSQNGVPERGRQKACQYVWISPHQPMGCIQRSRLFIYLL
jgi:surface protein